MNEAPGAARIRRHKRQAHCEHAEVGHKRYGSIHRSLSIPLTTNAVKVAFGPFSSTNCIANGRVWC